MKNQMAVMVVLAMVMALALATGVGAADARSLQVSLGEAITLPLQNVEKLAVAEPTVADVVALSGKEISVIGKKIGVTTLTVVPADGKPTVIYRIEVVNETVGAVVRQMAGQASVTVRAIGDALVLDGQVDDELQANRAAVVAGAFSKTPVVNLLEVRKPRQIRVRTRVAEVDRTISRQIGLKWFGDDGSVRYAMDIAFDKRKILDLLHGTTGSPLASATQAQSPTDRDLGAQVMLQMLEQRGYARVLSEPTLVTMSGKKASFAVGSEIPIVQQLPQSFTVLYKQAGIIMEVTPTADSQNRILTVLHAEVSQPVQVSPANATLVLYRIDTRKADTTLQMNDRQTMVIGGLLDNQITPDITQRVPWFADIPVLGLLFRHKSSQRAEKEVLFFMTPEIIKDIDADTAKAARTPAMRDWNGKTGLEDFLPLPDKNADWGLHHPDGLGIPKLDLPWPPGAKPVDENSRVPIENVPPPKTNYKPMRPAGGGE